MEHGSSDNNSSKRKALRQSLNYDWALCYPNNANLEIHGWKAQGREWE
jgi:hypothetical protein